MRNRMGIKEIVGASLIPLALVLILLSMSCEPDIEQPGTDGSYSSVPWPPTVDRLMAWDGSTGIVARTGGYLELVNGETISNMTDGTIYLVVEGGGLRVVGNATSPSIVGGYSGNVASGTGAVVAGGGIAGSPNTIVNSPRSAIVGGQGNLLNKSFSTFFAYNFIGGGLDNKIEGTLATGLSMSSIVGGQSNRIIEKGDQSFIGGGYSNIISDTLTGMSFIGGGSSNVTVGNGHATITGGQDNIAGHYGSIGGGSNNDASAANYATISGGTSNVASGTYAAVVGGQSNTASGDYAAVAGGQSNTASGYGSTVGGGRNGTASENYSAVGGGYGNTASGLYAVSGGGINNTASGDYSAVGGGYTNTASGDYAAVTGGYRGIASDYGQQAHATGLFAANGDAQHGTWVSRRSIAMSATWTALYLDGSSEEIGIASDQVMTLHILLVGTRSGAAESWGYEIVAVVENDGGTTTVLAQTVTTLYEDDANYNARILADNANDTIEIQVVDSGASGNTVRWVAVVDAAEVTFP